MYKVLFLMLLSGVIYASEPLYNINDLQKKNANLQINENFKDVYTIKADVNDSVLTGTTTIQGLNTGGKVWQLISSSVLTSSATSITISGLDGNTSISYELRYYIRGSGSNTLGILFNADSGLNYGYQVARGEDTTFVGARNTNYGSIAAGGCSAGQVCVGVSVIFAKSGKERMVVSTISWEASTKTITRAGILNGIWNNTTDNITSITLVGATNGIGIGSYIELWGRK